MCQRKYFYLRVFGFFFFFQSHKESVSVHWSMYVTLLNVCLTFVANLNNLMQCRIYALFRTQKQQSCIPEYPYSSTCEYFPTNFKGSHSTGCSSCVCACWQLYDILSTCSHVWKYHNRVLCICSTAMHTPQNVQKIC